MNSWTTNLPVYSHQNVSSRRGRISRAGPLERACDLSADALGGSGDKGYLAFQVDFDGHW
jgi:hypothetical protein